MTACFKDVQETPCTERSAHVHPVARNLSPPECPVLALHGWSCPEAPAVLVTWRVPWRRLAAVLPWCLAGTVRRVGEVLLTTWLPLQISTWQVNFQQVSADSSGLVSIGETFLQFCLWWFSFHSGLTCMDNS